MSVKVTVQCECDGCKTTFTPQAKMSKGRRGERFELQNVLFVAEEDDENLLVRYGTIMLDEVEGGKLACSRSCATKIIDRFLSEMQGIKDVKPGTANGTHELCERPAGGKQ
jgi:hypothetical protein